MMLLMMNMMMIILKKIAMLDKKICSTLAKIVQHQLREAAWSPRTSARCITYIS